MPHAANIVVEHRDVTRVVKGDKITWVPNPYGGASKSPNKVKILLYSIQYICFRKTSGANMGTPKWLFAPDAI